MRGLLLIAMVTLAVSVNKCGSSGDSGAVNPPGDTGTDSVGLGVSTLAWEVIYPNVTFDRPLDIQFLPDNSNRAFVVEQPGVIRIVDNSAPSTSVATTFLDITDRVNDAG